MTFDKRTTLNEFGIRAWGLLADPANIRHILGFPVEQCGAINGCELRIPVRGDP